MSDIKQKAREKLLNILPTLPKTELNPGGGFIAHPVIYEKQRDLCIEVLFESIDFAIAERDKEIVEMIKKENIVADNSDWQEGFDYAQSHFIDLITNTK